LRAARESAGEGGHRPPRGVPGRRALAAAAVLALALLTLGFGQESGPKAGSDEPAAAWRARLVDDGRRARLEDVSGLDCLRCHAAVGDEWRDSAHAVAWQDEHYQRELASVRKSQRERCHGCHVPVPLATAASEAERLRPAARSEDRHLGVACATCHLDADGVTILGPFGLETEAHPTRRSERLLPRGDLCLACHSTTIGPVVALGPDYVATEQAEVETCVECHMPARRGPIANDPETQVDHPERSGRSHRLATPRDPQFLASAFALEAEVEGALAVLSIANRAGHRVPGTTNRRITFRLRVVDTHGETVERAQHTIDYQAYLPPDESVRVEVQKRSGARLEVEGWHESLGLRRPVRFLSKGFDL